MSGHSKWSTIKRKKGAKDAQRSKVFSKLIKEITVSARIGGGDPSGNPRLRLAVQKAREANMPQDNIRKAIQKGTGEIEGAVYDEIVYEGFGPGGVALLVECLTENRNRTANDVRHALERHGGHLGQTGAVGHLFATRGCVMVESATAGEDAVFAAALEGGADDVRREGDDFEVLTAPSAHAVAAVTSSLERAGIAAVSAEVARMPLVTVAVAGAKAAALLKLVDLLEDLDDVQKVYANFDISAEEMAKRS
jgi:YebC/PmpR family DNA-binding regulatory protein